MADRERPVGTPGTADTSVPSSQIISIVDDDDSLRDAVEDLITTAGYQAVAFESAEDFLRSPQCANTSFLISDVQMPGMSGPELHRHLRAEGRNIPTIFITAYPTKMVREQAEANGALAVLEKPFNSGTLMSLVQAALNKA
jgi:FixJ family two-component response regulator